MHSKRLTEIVRISFLATAVCLALAGPSQSVAATQSDTHPQDNSSSNPFAKLLDLPKQLTKAAKDVDNKVSNPNKTQRDILGSVIAIMTLLMSGIPILLKSYESFAIQSKTKDLDRIQNLIALMEKTKKEKVLEGATLDRICAQIDQEILYALESMERAREHRKQVLEKRRLTLEMKRARQDPELPYVNSVLLRFRPHGPSAWLAHTIAYGSAFIAILGCVLIAARYNDERGLWLATAVGSLALCFLSRKWALWERKQWKTSRETGIPMRTMFFRPRNLRTGLALVFAYLWLFLVFVFALACVSVGPEFYIVLIPSLLFLWASRKWVLYERKRWDGKQSVRQMQSLPEVVLMEKAEGAALPAGPG